MSKKFFVWNPLYWPLWALFGFFWCITTLPFKWQITIGKNLGKILYCFPGKLKTITRINIALCFPELSPADQILLAKKNFESIGIAFIETAMAWWLPDNKLKNLYQIKGLEHMEAALKKGKGIILLGPHFTCLEIVGRLVGMNYTFAVMYRPHKKPLIQFIHNQFRKKHYLHYIPRHRLRQLLRTLNNNIPVWYAYDIDGGYKNSVFAPLFNIPTASLTAVSRLVRLTGSAVIPIYFKRLTAEGRYEIILSEPLDNFPEADEITNATRLNKTLEDAIRDNPEQYVWQYKRFKTRPPHENRFY